MRYSYFVAFTGIRTLSVVQTGAVNAIPVTGSDIFDTKVKISRREQLAGLLQTISKHHGLK